MTRGEVERILGKLGPTRFLALADRYKMTNDDAFSIFFAGHYDALPNFHDGVIGVFIPQFSSSLGGSRRHSHSGNPQNPEIDSATIKKAVGDCVAAMYPHYELVDFKATGKPVRAKGNGGDDRFNGVTTIREVKSGVTAPIVSDPTPPKAELIDIQKHGRGLTHSNNPFWGYVAPDVDKLNVRDPSQIVYPALYGALPFLKTQVHELGGALGLITNIYYPQDYALFQNRLSPGHRDNGPAFEDCVGRHIYQSLGLTPTAYSTP
jgi:hypothetical protein